MVRSHSHHGISLFVDKPQSGEERGNRLHLLPWSSLSRVAIEGHGMVALAALVVAAACNHCQQPVDTTTVAPRQCQLDIQAYLRFTHEVSQIMKQFKCQAAVLLCSLVLKMRGTTFPIAKSSPILYSYLMMLLIRCHHLDSVTVTLFVFLYLI